LDPLNYGLQEQLCTVLEDLARYVEAENACTRALVLQPGVASPDDHLSWLAESRGQIDAALRWNAKALKASPNDDFDLYWARATFFLSVGRAAPARSAVEFGRSATQDDDDANVALVRVVYCEGGADALRNYLLSARLEESTHAVALFEAAYARMLLGEVAPVKELIARALVAGDRIPGFAEDAWHARGGRPEGTPYRLNLAVAELAHGDRTSAQRELNSVLAMLDQMIAAGVERYGTYELRAKVYALEGRGDDAMRDLDKAAKLGWRRTWWATHEPYFASLQPRSDFQALMAQVSRSNDRLTEDMRVD